MMLYSFLLSLAMCQTISAFSIQPSSYTFSRTLENEQAYSIIYPHFNLQRSNRKNSNLFAADIGSDKSESGKVESAASEEEEEEEEDWEYVEYEDLRETDFYDSEWKVGTLMEGSNKIEETWTRLVVKDGEFICVWGDGSSGKWNFDAASQFLSMSKDSYGGWLGKRIWAGTIDDYYYVQGTIRGWSPISPASVVGQWQAKRLGVDKDEAGVAPWFDEDDEEDEDEKEVGLEAASGEEESSSL